MSHKHKVIIEKVFSHPIATNLDWKKLAATLEHLGAKIDVSHANRAHIILDDAELILSLPHHAHELTNKEDVTKLRHFLEAQGITPDSL